jgi:hypothetical protein
MEIAKETIRAGRRFAQPLPGRPAQRPPAAAPAPGQRRPGAAPPDPGDRFAPRGAGTGV